MTAGDDWSAVPDRDRGVAPVDGTGQEAPGATHGPLASAPGRVQGRPAPQYGEYAPDGWVNPVVVEQERRERAAAAAAAAAPAARPAPTGARPAAGAGTPVTARFGASPADFLLTVLLLAFGLVSVLQSLAFRSVAAQVTRELELRYTELSDPGAVVTAALVSAIGGLVLFVLVAWWSVVRLRHRKRTVWVPLLGGLVASLLTLSAFLTVMLQDGRFVAWLMQNAGG